MGRKKWILGKINKEIAAEIAAKFSVDPFAALLLSQRNLKNDAEIAAFLSGDAELSDPFLLPDMQTAVDRINDAIFAYEKICVYGDYDADGVTSTVLLYSYLEAQGANVTYMIPDRQRDGYGLSMQVVDRIKEIGTDLIITVDNGIAAVEEAQHIKELGMELIITDHHLPGKVLPDCVAVVDPHRTDVSCPYVDFAGVGVAFKLACAMEGDCEAVIYDFAYLAAIGTVADIVPLTGENRKLVKLGLDSLNTYPRPGIASLMKVCGLDGKPIVASNISFAIGPRINAAGRMGSAEKAIELLLCEEPETADEIASELNKMNTERHEAENRILSDCMKYIESNPSVVHAPVLVVYGEDWHEGVLGIVASKLLERYMRPVIVFSVKGEFAKGSARSIEGFSIFDAICACKEYLTIFGGHDQAAGLTLPTNKIDAFITALNGYVYEHEAIRNSYPELKLDCKLNSDSLSIDLLDSMCALEPFGAENPSPVFGLFEMVIDNITALGDKKQHLKISAHKNGKTKQINMMKFNTPQALFPYKAGDVIDTAVTLDRNEWNGETSLSTIIKDVRPSGSDDALMALSERLYDLIALERPLTGKQAEFAMPDRQLFASVYTYLKRIGNINVNSYEYLYAAVGGKDNNLCRVRVVLLALCQLNLISVCDDGSIKIEETSDKVDLSDAPVLKYIQSFIL